MDEQVKRSVLAEAEMVINGPRREAYGPVEESFKRIAAVWNVTLYKHLKEPITANEVALCMVGLKLCWQANNYGRDNLVDICGYAALMEKLADVH